MRAYTVLFYRHKLTRLWRWKITATNGRRISASTESYWNKNDCIHNAEITGRALTSHFREENKLKNK